MLSFLQQIVIMRRRNHCTSNLRHFQSLQNHQPRNEVPQSSRVYRRSCSDMLTKVTILLVLLPHMAQTKYTRGKLWKLFKNQLVTLKLSKTWWRLKTGAAYEKHYVLQVENVLFQTGVFHDEMYVSKLLQQKGNRHLSTTLFPYFFLMLRYLKNKELCR